MTDYTRTIERLRTLLQGVAGCSTCSACHDVAHRAVKALDAETEAIVVDLTTAYMVGALNCQHQRRVTSRFSTDGAEEIHHGQDVLVLHRPFLPTDPDRFLDWLDERHK